MDDANKKTNNKPGIKPARILILLNPCQSEYRFRAESCQSEHLLIPLTAPSAPSERHPGDVFPHLPDKAPGAPAVSRRNRLVGGESLEKAAETAVIK